MSKNLRPVGAPMVQQVLLCDRLTRKRGHFSESSSLPGHLIQLTLTGRTVHDVEGRRYVLKPGHLIWYHEDELVRVNVLQGLFSFYTLNFLAPSLPPPAFEQRVHKVGKRVRDRFSAVVKAWRAAEASQAVRALRVHAAVDALLAEILITLDTATPTTFETDASAALWWKVEAQLRENLAQPISLATLVRLTGRSPATLARACHAATGMPPIKRVKRIRLSLARGLVQRSDLSIGQVAELTGYTRGHELSRDYRKHFGLAPRDDRRSIAPVGPDRRA